MINLNYTCKDCANDLAICFICKKKGKYYYNESKSKKKKHPRAVSSSENTGTGSAENEDLTDAKGPQENKEDEEDIIEEVSEE